MAQYKVNHRYSARRDEKQFGPYEPDAIVDLDPADADWVERDSPGCLTDLSAAAETSKVDGDGGADPGKDRQHKGGRRRS